MQGAAEQGAAAKGAAAQEAAAQRAAAQGAAVRGFVMRIETLEREVDEAWVQVEKRMVSHYGEVVYGEGGKMSVDETQWLGSSLWNDWCGLSLEDRGSGETQKLLGMALNMYGLVAQRLEEQSRRKELREQSERAWASEDCRWRGGRGYHADGQQGALILAQDLLDSWGWGKVGWGWEENPTTGRKQLKGHAHQVHAQTQVQAQSLSRVQALSQSLAEERRAEGKALAQEQAQAQALRQAQHLQEDAQVDALARAQDQLRVQALALARAQAITEQRAQERASAQEQGQERVRQVRRERAQVQSHAQAQPQSQSQAQSLAQSQAQAQAQAQSIIYGRAQDGEMVHAHLHESGRQPRNEIVKALAHVWVLELSKEQRMVLCDHLQESWYGPRLLKMGLEVGDPKPAVYATYMTAHDMEWGMEDITDMCRYEDNVLWKSVLFEWRERRYVPATRARRGKEDKWADD